MFSSLRRLNEPPHLSLHAIDDLFLSKQTKSKTKMKIKTNKQKTSKRNTPKIKAMGFILCWPNIPGHGVCVLDILIFCWENLTSPLPAGMNCKDSLG